jgi:hypothetical protein
VLFDANGIIHQACRRCANEKEVIKTVIRELDSLLRSFPAQRTVLIALDGPGPTAKLMEQRKRRIDKVLKSARDAEALIPGSAENVRRLELCRLEGRPPPSANKKKRKSTDSLQVTPGTMFMLRMRRALVGARGSNPSRPLLVCCSAVTSWVRVVRPKEWYAASRLCGAGHVFHKNRPTMFVSAADVAGEGEIKLLQHLHAVLRSEPSGSAPPSFLLVGPDADLLLLGLSAGSPRCDVLTTDSEGSHQLFRVRVLCEHCVRQVSARPPPPPAAPDGVSVGGLTQLDFLVVAFLQGNDYLPKLRGAKMDRMWSKLVTLVRSGGAFCGQHLLSAYHDRIEINLHMLVELACASCSRVDQANGTSCRGRPGGGRGGRGGHGGRGGDSGRGCEVEAGDAASALEEEEDDDDDDDEAEGDLDTSTPAPPGGRGKRHDVEAYLRTLAWCACMYLSGRCPDFGEAYAYHAAPSSGQLAAYLRERTSADGTACRPSYLVPPAGGPGALPVGTPDVFCLCLLPAAAAPYLPRPLQPLMEPSHPLADVFHSHQLWPHDLVRRVTTAAQAVRRATPRHRHTAPPPRHGTTTLRHRRVDPDGPATLPLTSDRADGVAGGSQLVHS